MYREYLATVENLLEKITDTQKEMMEQAADALSNTLFQDGLIYIFGGMYLCWFENVLRPSLLLALAHWHRSQCPLACRVFQRHTCLCNDGMGYSRGQSPGGGVLKPL